MLGVGLREGPKYHARMEIFYSHGPSDVVPDV